MQFDHVEDAIAWLTGRTEERKLLENNEKLSAFCAHFKNRRRCGLAPHEDGPHVLYRDDSLHFGKERRIPSVAHFDTCTKWGLHSYEGLCTLAAGHAGDHIFKLLEQSSNPEALTSAERCNVWSHGNGVRCVLRYDHRPENDHKFPRLSRDVTVPIEATRRPCKLIENMHCSGQMVGTMVLYAEARIPMLLWSCATCGKRVSWPGVPAKHDKRVETAVAEGTYETALSKALSSIHEEAIETTNEEATGDLGIAARAIRDAIAE